MAALQNLSQVILELGDETVAIWSFLLALQWAAGLILNSLAFIAILKTKTVSALKNIFILNLMASDMATLLMNIPMLFVSLIQRVWLFGDIGCMAFGITTLLFSTGSTCSVVLVAIER